MHPRISAIASLIILSSPRYNFDWPILAKGVYVSNFKSVLVLMLAFLAPALVQSAEIEITNLAFKPNDSAYKGIDQKSSEQRATEGTHIFLEFRRDGKNRRLWDDDGLASLFLYHRAHTLAVQKRELSPDSPLPGPHFALTEALDLLKAAYAKAGAAAAHPGESIQIDFTLEKIESIRKYIDEGKLTKVRGLADSGLESLINGLAGNHNYNVEVGGDRSVRVLLNQAIAVNLPATLTEA